MTCALLVLTLAVGVPAQVSQDDDPRLVVPPGQATPPILVVPPDDEEGTNAPAPKLRALGRGCLEADECRSGRCSVSPASKTGRGQPPTRTIEGVCIRKDGTARVGMFCTDTNQCRRGTCEDERCTRKDLGGSCRENRTCKSGLCQESLCQLPLFTGVAGQFCTANAQCVEQNCADGLCVADGTAKNYQDCLFNSHCESGICETSVNNSSYKYCVPPTDTLLTGERCNLHNDCKGNLVCNEDPDSDFIPEGIDISPYSQGLGAGVCTVPYKDFGEYCYFDRGGTIFNFQNMQSKNECANGYCEQSSEVCVPNDGEGENGVACTQNDQCQTGRCLTGFCSAETANQPLGAACVLNTDCSSNICDAQRQACVATNNTLVTGQFCTQDNQCQNNLVCVSSYDANYNDYDFLASTCAPPSTELGGQCSRYEHTKDPCATGYCDSGMGSGNDRCTANDGTAQAGDWCDDNNQCATLNCNQDADPPRCDAVGSLAMGEICELDNACQSGRCDAADDLRRCIPNDGTGVVGEFCTHQNHCLGGLSCKSLVTSPPGSGMCLE